jgi:hypothetical protein
VELPEGVELTVLLHEGEDPTVVTVMPPREVEEEVLEVEAGVEGEEGVEGEVAVPATDESAGDADSSKE